MDVAPASVSVLDVALVSTFQVGLEAIFEVLGGEVDVEVVLVVMLVAIDGVRFVSWEFCTLLYVTPTEFEDKDEDEDGAEGKVGFA